MVEVTKEDLAFARTVFQNAGQKISDAIEYGDEAESENAIFAIGQTIAAHRTATLQRVIDLANACVDQGIPLTAMVPMLEDMR